MYDINSTAVFVYKLPGKLSDGFCFEGGNPVTFLNVDWFNGADGMNRDMLEKEVQNKVYVQAGETYLVLSPENDISFTFTGKPRP